MAGRKFKRPPWVALPLALFIATLICALFGFIWDVSLHIGKGRDPGPLANPAHYFILLDTFDAVDRATASALTTEGVPQAPPHPSTPRVPDKRTDPRLVKEWWDSLSPEERQWLADDEPGRIGNLNGIPVAIRDYANRKATRQDLERVRRAAGSADVSAEVVLTDPGRYGLIQSDVTRYAMPKASRAASNSTVRRTPTNVPKNPVLRRGRSPGLVPSRISKPQLVCKSARWIRRV